MLRDAFSAHAEPVHIRVPTDRETGQVKGFAYVEFGSVDEAKKALESCQGMEVDGRSLRLDYAGQKPAGDNAGGGRGGRGGRGGARGGFRGGRGGRGGSRGGFGGVNKAKGNIAEFKGTKVTFDD